MRTIPYPTPGEILLEEFLKPLEMTSSHLAREIGVSESKINEIISGKRIMNADMGLRLSRYFGLSESFWTGLQDDYERAIAKDKLQSVLIKIKPLDFSQINQNNPI